jgi:hypothetical protein
VVGEGRMTPNPTGRRWRPPRPNKAQRKAAFLWHLVTPEEIMQAATTPELRVEAARTLGVSLRTVQRYQADSHPCPGPACLTLVKGGGMCSFCRRSAE